MPRTELQEDALVVLVQPCTQDPGTGQAFDV